MPDLKFTWTPEFSSVAATAFFVLIGLGAYGSVAYSGEERGPSENRLSSENSERGVAVLVAGDGRTMSIRDDSSAGAESDHSHPSSTTSAAEHRKIYRQLQATCSKWTRWYRNGKSNRSAIHMNVSCRDAANYGREKLGIKAPAVKTVALKNKKGARAGGNAVLLGARDDASSPACLSLKRQKKSVEAKLRKGYKARQGENLRERRREIRDAMLDSC